MTLFVEGVSTQTLRKREHRKAWYYRNRERVLAEQRARRAAGKVVHPYKQDPGRRKDGVLKRLYGIGGREHWEAIFDAQGRKCACCNSADPQHPRGWMVDHDHNNPRPNYRAILCAPCNIAIGNARECPSRLRSCADYLDRQSVRQNNGEVSHGK